MNSFKSTENKRFNDILNLIWIVVIIFMIRSCVINNSADFLCRKTCELRGRTYWYKEVDGIFHPIKCFCGYKKEEK